MKKNLSPAIKKLLIEQTEVEFSASMTYLHMATWADLKELKGIAKFLYDQSAEEREHMLKFVRYLVEQEEQPVLPVANMNYQSYSSTLTLFKKILAQEIAVTKRIHLIAQKALEEGDVRTFSFLGYFIEEQREEEATAREAVALCERMGSERLGLQLLDQAIGKLAEKEDS